MKRLSAVLAVLVAVAGFTFADSYRIPTDANKSGESLVVVSSVTSSSIANNAQTSPMTAAAYGNLILNQVVVQCDATGWAAPTNIEITVNNAKGLTGAASPIVLEPIASFGANLTFIATLDGTTKILPMLLESGKKVFIHGDDAAGTGAGVCDVALHFTRAADGATIAAVNVP